MMKKFRIFIKKWYLTVVNSIAFYPAFIAILFLIVSYLLITFDFSETGKNFKANLPWLSLKDATTARSIISSIVAGIISLTVFSFSMVMIVLNQTASQMSNRILDKLIGNRLQQVILGIYIGTIVYALFLLSTIRNIDSGIHIPALSTYVLILLTILDIFLFIYFLHYITQSVKYVVIIQRIFVETFQSMKKFCHLDTIDSPEEVFKDPLEVAAKESGVYEGYDKDALVEICDKHDCIVSILHAPGTFILAGNFLIQLNKKINDDAVELIWETILIHDTESISENYNYGFRQLMEVALKALSPGINDPGTAVESLRALFKLLASRVCIHPNTIVRNKKNVVRIISREKSFDEVFDESIIPIWNYGKNDRMIIHELYHLLKQLLVIRSNERSERLLKEIKLSAALK